MTLYIQRAEEDDTGEVVYEVFRRSTAPADQTVDVVDNKQQAIALAGRVAEPGEAIEEFPRQGSFDFLARGPGAAQETPRPETSDTGGGFIDFVAEGIEFFSDPDQTGGESGGGGDGLQFFSDPDEDGGGSGGPGPSDPMGAIEAFEEDIFGGEEK